MFIDIMLTVALGVLGFIVIMMEQEISNQSKELDDLQAKLYILKDKTREVENRIRFLEISTKPPLTLPSEGE